ncbi:hypothetical protein Pan44_51630 [Caulifigura coniformis]|uniref:Uncharacterized protein n=1 Tax=Caulifigura coniformis TaxID=2527983 RepID=A0A517SLT5_9PLAN|nr:hypothetical protein [Caulifigura coniformis]QDT57097.1 hypothetical protein Pan44_51630 [Caulifigura coniformis]
MEDFANDQTESLSFEDYDNLNWWEAKLRAYGNLLEDTDPESFLNEELREADEFLDWMRQRTDVTQVMMPLRSPLTPPAGPWHGRTLNEKEFDH